MSFDSKGIRALLFDLDGTLIDSQEDIAAASNSLRSSRGLPARSLELVASYIGEGIEALVRKLMPSAEGADLAALVEEFRKYYFDHCVEQTHLYEGVAPTLKSLAGQGYRMGVVTNKPERISIRILELLGARDFFGCVIGGNSCQNKKPHPEPLEEACRRLKVELSSACMIGDSRVDIEAGKNAGIPSLGILGGIGNEALLTAAGPSLILKRFADLEDIFKGAL
jgi:2-phosphoglycolate phosphatase